MSAGKKGSQNLCIPNRLNKIWIFIQLGIDDDYNIRRLKNKFTSGFKMTKQLSNCVDIANMNSFKQLCGIELPFVDDERVSIWERAISISGLSSLLVFPAFIKLWKSLIFSSKPCGSFFTIESIKRFLVTAYSANNKYNIILY